METDWLQSLQKGCRLDIFDDKYHKEWYVGTVKIIVHDNDRTVYEMLIHYEGYSKNYNEWITVHINNNEYKRDAVNTEYDRVKPLYTMTPCHENELSNCKWRSKLKKYSCTICNRYCCKKCFMITIFHPSKFELEYQCKECFPLRKYNDLFKLNRQNIAIQCDNKCNRQMQIKCRKNIQVRSSIWPNQPMFICFYCEIQKEKEIECRNNHTEYHTQICKNCKIILCSKCSWNYCDNINNKFVNCQNYYCNPCKKTVCRECVACKRNTCGDCCEKVRKCHGCNQTICNAVIRHKCESCDIAFCKKYTCEKKSKKMLIATYRCNKLEYQCKECLQLFLYTDLFNLIKLIYETILRHANMEINVIKIITDYSLSVFKCGNAICGCRKIIQTNIYANKITNHFRNHCIEYPISYLRKERRIIICNICYLLKQCLKSLRKTCTKCVVFHDDENMIKCTNCQNKVCKKCATTVKRNILKKCKGKKCKGKECKHNYCDECCISIVQKICILCDKKNLCNDCYKETSIICSSCEENTLIGICGVCQYVLKQKCVECLAIKN
eukprot:376175_1